MVPWLIGHGLSNKLYEVRRLIGAIAKVCTTLDVVRSTIGHAHVIRHILAIVGVVDGVLLAVDHGDSVNVVVLIVIGVLVPPHDEFLLCSFEADGTNRFVAL